MYHLRSSYVVRLFKLAAWLLLLKWLLISSAIGLLLASWITIDKQLAGLALGMIAATILLGAIQWALSSHARCPLCVSPPLAHRRCSKHHKAGLLLGSYRFRVACTVAFRNYFRCPYCGESTAIKTRVDRPTG